MDRRTAKRVAHWWVAGIIDGALANGCDDPAFVDLDATDRARLVEAVNELRDAHDRDGMAPGYVSPSTTESDRWA